MQKAYNKADLCLLVVVAAMMALETIGGSAYEPLEEVGNIMLTIRFATQLCRIINLFKQYKELRIVQKMGDITLPELDIVDELEAYHSYG